MQQLLHTPAGVRDYYGEEYARKLMLCDKIRDTFRLYGYQDIMTPVFEYFDIFNAERGTIPSRHMYKLFDRDGETLVLRPDFTPAIARCASKYFAETALPIRLSYLGNTYVNTLGYRGQLKETTQAGAELVGEASVEGNAEVLAMIIDLFRSVGLTEFQIEVGDVRYFKGLLKEAGISDDVRAQLRTCIENKNHFGLEEILEENHIEGQLARVLIRLPHLFGSPEEILEEAEKLTSNTVALRATQRLKRLCACLKDYGVSKYITLDLGMLGLHEYYTGIIFKGYTYGTGDHIVTGGRYDHLLEQFGREAPSIGFGINVDILQQALTSQHIPMQGRKPAVLIMFDSSRFAEAAAKARELRERKIPVHMLRMKGMDAAGIQNYIHENHVVCTLEYAGGRTGIVQKGEVPVCDI